MKTCNLIGTPEAIEGLHCIYLAAKMFVESLRMLTSSTCVCVREREREGGARGEKERERREEKRREKRLSHY